MANVATRILGLDPGLRRTGWGVVVSEGSRLAWVAHGVVSPPDTLPLSERLLWLLDKVGEVCAAHACDEAAIEEVFVNVNPASTLKLGQARAAVMLAPARAGLLVAEYSPNLIKKAVVGAGHADKTQIAFMVKRLLPTCGEVKADAADALAVAITHAQLRKRAILHRKAGEGDREGVEGATPTTLSGAAPSIPAQARGGPPPPFRFAPRGRIAS
ncbi:MAG: crossover junction endodeoxyribonuclease RuvC [Caulobacteraceae bacterium]|nr:crossover junction endodeoxyribonuclease RuvC [Caulobacteraceae bacterium]